MSTLPQATIERIEKEAETYCRSKRMFEDDFRIAAARFDGYIEAGKSEALRNLENEQEIQRLRKGIEAIMNSCDNQNNSHENIWRLAESLLSQPSQNKEV